MEGKNAIELKNISKRFGQVVANDKINLTVKKGEILSILGENGSGKTTLMNAMIAEIPAIRIVLKCFTISVVVLFQS